MVWKKLGQVYKPSGKGWKRSHGFCPTPLLLEDRVRLFTGFWGEDGKCRIGTVDVSREDPTQIQDVSRKPLVELAAPGLFDSDGMIPSFAFWSGKTILLLYTGWQFLAGPMKRLAFSGLLYSDEHGAFRRLYQAPVLERREFEPFMRTMPVSAGDFCYYLTASEVHTFGEWKVPRYGVAVTSSRDLRREKRENQEPTIALEAPEGVIGLGRPWILQTGPTEYQMWTSLRYPNEGYTEKIAHATSRFGKKFTWSGDKDKELFPSEEGWDSDMICFGAVVQERTGRFLMFYNGNNYGETGFGVAVLEQ